MFPTGRLPHFDPRSRDFDIATFGGPRPVRRLWRIRASLDQLRGRFSVRDQMGCTGFAFAHDLAADPVRVPVNDDSGLSLYYGGQMRDPWPDSPERGGTAVLFVAQEVQARGFMDSYYWAFTADALISALATGPVVLGSVWTEEMWEPTRQGVAHPFGPPVAGHAYLCHGYDLHKRFRLAHNRFTRPRAYLACQNSYAKRYGVEGKFWLPLDEWEGVLMHHPAMPAEVCVPVSRRDPRPLV